MKKHILYILALLFNNLVLCQTIISDDESYEARPNSVLDIFSKDKGVSFPTFSYRKMERLKSEFSYIEDGLIVFCTDIDHYGLHIYQTGKWNNLLNNTNILSNFNQIESNNSLFTTVMLKQYINKKISLNKAKPKTRLKDIIINNTISAGGTRISNLMYPPSDTPHLTATKKYIDNTISIINFSKENYDTKISIDSIDKLLFNSENISTSLDSGLSNNSIPSIYYIYKAIDKFFFFKKSDPNKYANNSSQTIELIKNNGTIYIGNNNTNDNTSTIVRGASSFTHNLSIHNKDSFNNTSENSLINIPTLKHNNLNENILTLTTKQFHIEGDFIITNRNLLNIGGNGKTSDSIYCDSLIYVQKKTSIMNNILMENAMFINNKTSFMEKVFVNDSLIINDNHSIFEKNVTISGELNFNKNTLIFGNTNILKNAILENYGKSNFNNNTTVTESFKAQNINAIVCNFGSIDVQKSVESFNKLSTENLLIKNTSTFDRINTTKSLTINTLANLNKTTQTNNLNVFGKLKTNLLDITGNFRVTPFSTINGSILVQHDLTTVALSVNNLDVLKNANIFVESTFEKEFNVNSGTFINKGNLKLNVLNIENQLNVKDKSIFENEVDVYGTLNIYNSDITPTSVTGDVTAYSISESEILKSSTFEIKGNTKITDNILNFRLTEIDTLETQNSLTYTLNLKGLSTLDTILMTHAFIDTKELCIKDKLWAENSNMKIKGNVTNWDILDFKPSVLTIKGNNSVNLGNNWIVGEELFTGIRIHPKGFVQVWKLDNIPYEDYKNYKGGDLFVTKDLVVNGSFDYDETVFTIPNVINTKIFKLSNKTNIIKSYADLLDLSIKKNIKYEDSPKLLINNRVGIHNENPVCRLHIGGVPYKDKIRSYLRFYSHNGPKFTIVNMDVGIIEEKDILVYIKGSAYFDALSISNNIFIASDKRVKNIIKKSNTQEDLRILRKVEIVDYTKIDKIKNGHKIEKKVIAQQIETIFPQAISEKRGFIPNIYKSADTTIFLANGMVDLYIKNKFNIGDVVKIIFEEFDSTHQKISEQSEITIVEKRLPESIRVKLNNTFEKKNINSTYSVFIYGQQVEDLKIVDYDALSMLNVSATQELTRLLTQNDSILNFQDIWLTEKINNIKIELHKNRRKFNNIRKIEAKISDK